MVVEVTPVNIKNAEPALSHITTAFKTGKHVVTTNKGPLALSHASTHRTRRIQQCLLAVQRHSRRRHPHARIRQTMPRRRPNLGIRGILNGTTNYILTEMSQNRVTFQDALSNAQKLGYAEREPSMDIDGFDTACKIVILANWILNKKSP